MSELAAASVASVTVVPRETWWDADVRFVRGPGGVRVLKSFAPAAATVRWTYGRWSIAHEAKIYAALRGVPGVPRGRRTGRYELTLEFVAGRELKEFVRSRDRRALPPGFFRRLRAVLRRIHRHGVFHLDLRHRTNILIDEAGRPHLIDFTSAIALRPGTPLSRVLAPILRRIDLLAVLKYERKVRPESRPGAERRGLGFRALLGSLWNGPRTGLQGGRPVRWKGEVPCAASPDSQSSSCSAPSGPAQRDGSRFGKSSRARTATPTART